MGKITIHGESHTSLQGSDFAAAWSDKERGGSFFFFLKICLSFFSNIKGPWYGRPEMNRSKMIQDQTDVSWRLPIFRHDMLPPPVVPLW